MIARPLRPPLTPRAGTMFAAAEIAVLNKLRLLAAKARCAPRVDMVSACSLLAMNPTTAATAYADALLRSLGQGGARALVIYHPGAAEISGDEAWILRAVLSAEGGDEDSLHFLTQRRLPKPMIRPVIFLIRNLAARLDTL